MLSYKILISYLKKQNIFKINITSNYCVITLQNKTYQYHITIYQDQWDDYENVTKFPYHLFHISSNNEKNKCSSYFWVDKSNFYIRTIPKKYFNYGQQNFSFYSSRRQPCKLSMIKILIKAFQKFLQSIKNRDKIL